MQEVGLVGLGTMGAALALNIAEKGFRVAVNNRTTSVIGEFVAGAGPLAERVAPCPTLADLAAALKTPRAVILMVPAGEPVDAMIAALREVLGPDDLIIDAGNANFRDTRRRAAEAEAAGLPFLGIGVSGGEEGARHGPSIMGGGAKAGWDRVAPVLEAISAKFEGTPCATWMGPDGAGHFVKTVHNGIEYADMQMIAEVYGIMRDGLGMTAGEIGAVFARWNEGPLASYLVEIAAKVADTVDTKTGKPLLDVILDRAGQKGTGRWTAIEAQHLAAPVTAIEAAVAARNLSARLEERKAGEAIFGAAPERITGDAGLVPALEQALLAGKIASYAQGFGLLVAASGEYGWAVPLPEVAKVWRAGCIIRSAMLDDMARALSEHPGTNLMFAPSFAERMKASHGALRRVVSVAALSGNPAPALGAALAYFDAMRTGRGTANMIQGQRDFFGLHSFERIDESGGHHGPWARG
ncbi:MAG TPA: NADP-dependent phosphogluconate dehydrogenase [Amaricoccus sp.]|uniref:NADP-dependent phosphogluconate dehydrogenase n=1 Tax=Amaricoccus sp. TaxID=1872485 RepID=UPI002C26CC3F|nr:NADP-dependent phosphogluconate dehydrogenase [Amaricoccus sp.]HMQ93145.1 NADP-dependent phosphogluconate dehydrogenase [Amaricoccus sp.]HMR52363.1 NADP-dependent phosphogluconate dehydrogenase [Amaricoccus sp.]HMR61440.1 NADP-dependent phosphogluconate dehydrogenase [Amaricoccus sp.]HMT99284.1 NADP-dependent phosphogluconate dehydrogenase [Amaricoccus sp.]